MDWRKLRAAPWLDTRAKFVAATPHGGRLLDLGTSDGETLRHFAELRPDLKLLACDIEGRPEVYPEDTDFFRGDLQRDRLPWPDGSVDAVTCMHLVEHLHELGHLFGEVARLLRPGGRAYFETPHPKTVAYSSPRGAAAGTYTMNFYDDPTHTTPVSTGRLAQHARRAGLEIAAAGTSRNLLFALAWPVLMFTRPSRKRFTACGHFRGWSAYLVARRMG